MRASPALAGARLLGEGRRRSWEGTEIGPQTLQESFLAGEPGPWPGIGRGCVTSTPHRARLPQVALPGRRTEGRRPLPVLERGRRDPRAEATEPPAEPEASLLESYACSCSPSEQASAREELERIEQAFAALPPECREAILLVRVAGLDHAQAAEGMDRSLESLRPFLYRGLALLSESLGD